MNKEVENIQKNLQTVFEGYVNGQKFTSREVMNQFIGKCISEGTPITDISYSTTTQYKPQGNDGTQQRQPSTHMRPGYNAIRRAQEEISWVTYLNNINQRVPKPYDNVIGYVVPFVREDITINDLRLQQEEVHAVRFADEDTILRMIQEGRFIPYHEAYIRLLFTMRTKTGSFFN